MRLRRALGYAALGIGAAAVTNAVLEREAGDLHPALSGMQRTFRWRGMNAAYTERGDTSNPTLVLLHGIHAAASSAEWRAVFEDLAETYHVVAPDLPGFGRSERPPLRYSAALYEDFLADFLAAFDEPGVLASSLTGAYAVAAARETPVARLVLVCPTATAGPRRAKAWVHELFRLPVVGEALFNGLTARPAIRYFEDRVAGTDRLPDDDLVDYDWLTAHQHNARFAPAAFVAGYLNSEVDLAETIADLDAETTLVWGRDATLPPLSTGREIASEAGCGLVVFDDSRLLPHLDWPDQFVAVVRGDVSGGSAGESPGETATESAPKSVGDEAGERAGDSTGAGVSTEDEEPAEPVEGAEEPAEPAEGAKEPAEPADDDDEATDEFEYVDDADAVSVEARRDGSE